MPKCHKCGSNGKEVNHCKRIGQHLCRDCCVGSNGGMDKCEHWSLCWPSYY